ncbi:hypothetical protein PMKS-003492 [Pichia membranifaciens]|uniref:Uncharacterized protein n=1 Tax=Pichia membranifaciens TaxID=4926 RepID=A0A1Q2YKA0_9ASCO|nr:hypothetical protein PMKS-003492 [Pichia membranifaciens]
MLFSVCASPKWIEEPVASTAIALTGTTQFIEARRSDYKLFKTSDLWARANTILQIQFFMLYQWSLVRFLIAHPTAEAFIPHKYYLVGIQNFTPEESDIRLYLQEPKFLWRFSIRNYGYFAKVFGRYLPFYSFTDGFADGKFATYQDDDSPLMPYIRSSGEIVKFTLKHKLKMSQSLNSHGVRLERIKQIESKFQAKILTPFEKSEYLHSDDFHLHLMGGDFDYVDFVQTLITGHTFRGPGALLQMDIQQSNQLLKDEKTEKKLIKKEKKKLKKESKEQRKNKKIEAKKLKKTQRKNLSVQHSVIQQQSFSTETNISFGETLKSSMRLIRSMNSNVNSIIHSSSSKYSTMNSSVARERLSRRVTTATLAQTNPYLSSGDHTRNTPTLLTSEFVADNGSNLYAVNIVEEPIASVSVVEHINRSGLQEKQTDGFIGFARQSQSNEIPTPEVVEIVECFDPPQNALPYLGRAGKVDKNLRLAHLIRLAKVRKEIVPVFNDYYTCSFWNHRALLSDCATPQSLYKVAYQYFGESINVNHFVELAGDGQLSRVGWQLPCTSTQQSNFVARYLVAVENYKQQCNNHIPIVKKDSNGRWVTEKSPLYLGADLNEILNSLPSGKSIEEQAPTMGRISGIESAVQVRVEVQPEGDRNNFGVFNDSSDTLTSKNLITSKTQSVERRPFKNVDTETYYIPPRVISDCDANKNLAQTFNPWIDSTSSNRKEKVCLLPENLVSKDLTVSVESAAIEQMLRECDSENEKLNNTQEQSFTLDRGISSSQSDQISFHTCDLSLSPCGTEIEKMIDEKTDFLFSSVEARLSRIPINERTSMTVIQCVEEEMATRPRMRSFFYESKANYLKTGSPIDPKFAAVNQSRGLTSSSDYSLGVDINDFVDKSKNYTNAVFSRTEFPSKPGFSTEMERNSPNDENVGHFAHSAALNLRVNRKILIPPAEADVLAMDTEFLALRTKAETEVEMPIMKAEKVPKDCDFLNFKSKTDFPISDDSDVVNNFIDGLERKTSNSRLDTQTINHVKVLESKTDTNTGNRLPVADDIDFELVDYNRNNKYADVLSQVQELENLFKLMKVGQNRSEGLVSRDSNSIRPISKDCLSNIRFTYVNHDERATTAKTNSSEGANEILDIIDDYAMEESCVLNDENHSMNANKLCLKAFR